MEVGITYRGRKGAGTGGAGTGGTGRGARGGYWPIAKGPPPPPHVTGGRRFHGGLVLRPATCDVSVHTANVGV